MLLAMSGTALAGGSWMKSPDDRVEPGEEVLLIGYVGLEETPPVGLWRAALSGPRDERQNLVEGSIRSLPLGPVIIEPTGLGGYLSHRVSISFGLPANLEPGVYDISLSGDKDFLGDLIGASLGVGVDAEWPNHYEWALDDPAIALLPDDARVVGPGFEVTAAEIRAGNFPNNAAQFMLDPSALEEAVVETTTTAGPVTVPDANPPRIFTAPLWLILLAMLAGVVFLYRKRDKSPPRPADAISYEFENISQ